MKRTSALLWNLLTVVMLLASLGALVFFAGIYLFPDASFNPFPPQPLPLVLSLPTQTATPQGMLPPSATPTVTATAAPTQTPTETAVPTQTPTDTPAVTATPDPRITPTATLRPTATAGGYAFVVQDGSPAALSYAIYSDVGCQFLGVGGRVLGLDGSPITPGVQVRLRGFLDELPTGKDTLSGTATQFGDSGFLFQLSDHPIASNQALWVQLLDQSFLPMSDRVYFDTYDTCEQNLIFITFRQVR